MSFSTTLAMAGKDLRLVSRDHLGLFWLFALPLMFALFFGSLFGGGGEGRGRMQVALVDEDHSDESQRFARRLGESKAVAVEARDRAQALDDVRLGRKSAFVALKKGFSQDNLFASGRLPAPEVGIDPARQAEAGYLQGILMETLFREMAEQFTDRDRARKQLQRSIADLDQAGSANAAQRAVLKMFLSALDRFLAAADQSVMPAGFSGLGAQLDVVPVTRSDKQPTTAYEISFPQSILWGVLSCMAAFAIGIVRERASGSWLRLRVAPLTRVPILLGKGLACFVAIWAVIGLLLLLGATVFGVRVPDPLRLAAAISATGACFVGLMLLCSSLGRTEEAAAGATWGLILPMAMLGGSMVPLIAMPAWMLQVSAVSPVKWAITALEGAIWRGFTWAEMATPCAVLVAIGAVAGFVGIRLLGRGER